MSLLAGAFKIPIDLLNVFDPVPPTFADPAHGLYDSQLSASYRDNAVDYLETVGAPIRHTGLTVTSAAHEGKPADHITNEAEKTPDTLITMVTHGRSGVGRWVLGSVTDKVLHGTTSPLLITHAREEHAESSETVLKNLIVPLDGSQLAEQVVPHVEALANALKLNVNLVRVTPSQVEYYQYMDVPVANTDRFDDYTREADAGAAQYLQRIKERLIQSGVSSVVEHMMHGNAAGSILDLSQNIPDSLVALTTHGRSGVGRWVLGSVADRLVRHSGHPVLVIRSKG